MAWYSSQRMSDVEGALPTGSPCWSEDAHVVYPDRDAASDDDHRPRHGFLLTGDVSLEEVMEALNHAHR